MLHFSCMGILFNFWERRVSTHTAPHSIVHHNPSFFDLRKYRFGASFSTSGSVVVPHTQLPILFFITTPLSLISENTGLAKLEY